MTDVRFSPTFTFEPWVNNVDRITAGGPRGFNLKFDAIAADLQAVAGVVGQFNAVLGQPVGSPPGTVVFTPPLDFAVPNTGPGWTFDEIGALHPVATTTTPVTQVMVLTLPEHIRLQTFRAVGRYPGTPMTFSIGLFRASLLNLGQAPDKIAEITNTTTGITNPFDLSIPATSAFAAVDPNAFRYYILASATQVTATSSSAMSLNTVQLVYAGT